MKNKLQTIKLSLLISIFGGLVLNSACNNTSVQSTAATTQTRNAFHQGVEPRKEAKSESKLTKADSVVSQAKNNTKDDADRLKEEGEQLYAQGKYVQATEALEKAMNIYKEVGDTENYKETLETVLGIYFFTGGGEKDKIPALIAERDRLENGGEVTASSDSQKIEEDAEEKDSTELNSEVDDLISSGILAVQKEDFAGGQKAISNRHCLKLRK